MHVGHFGNNDMLDTGMRQHLLRVFRHVSQYHQGLGAGVVELVLHFTGGIQRVGVHHDHARTHGTENHNRVLGNVGHLYRDAVAGFQVGFVLKPCSKVAALGIKILVGQRSADCGECGAVTVFLNGLLKDIHHVLVFLKVYLPGNAGGVFVLIELLEIHHHLLSERRELIKKSTLQKYQPQKVVERIAVLLTMR